MKGLITICLVSLVVCSPAMATMITANMTVDNAFDLYLSTDDSQAGTYIGSGADWAMTFTFTFALTQGVTNYIHVVGRDYGNIAGLIGDFSISDTSFEFANGTQNIVTDSADWSISNVDFGQSYYTPDQIGFNGVGPWGFRPGISADASWIWSNYGYDTSVTRYFSSPIVPIPEPATICLLCLGGLSLLRKRRA